MTFTVPTAEQLGLYLDLAEINGDRADYLLAQAVELAQAIVSPLPDGATAVVLAVAARAYSNPTSANHQIVGPMAVQTTQPGGLYLSKSDRAALKSLAGRGGAFTYDPTPAAASPWPSWPEVIDEPFALGEYEPGWETT